MTLSPLHQAALDFAERGIPVFPCIAGGKSPACENGFHDATTDAAQINAWWEADPNYNVAFSPHHAGLAIVDLDGPEGAEAWAELQIENGFVETYTVASPREGQHLYFFGELPTSVNRIRMKVDTRGNGSYALVPPSRLDGYPNPYRVIDARTPAELPAWIPTHPGLQKREKATASYTDLDQPQNISRATRLLKDYVERGKVAKEGAGGDETTYRTACEVLNLGLSEEAAVELLDTVWNPHCLPPWERDELAIKVSNAASYAQNEAGSWATPPGHEVFGHVLDKLDLTPEPAGRSRFAPMSEDEQDSLSDPLWLYPQLLPEASTVMLYGESGTYKTFVALDWSLSLAAGIAAHGATERPGQDVVFVAGEGPRSISRQRRPAWRVAHQIEGPIPFHIVDAMPLMARPQEVVELVEAIKAKGLKPKLIVLDTLARALAGMNENDAKDAGIFIEGIEMLKRAFECTVLVIHHAGKESGKGARGSSALQAGFDAVFEVKCHKATKALAVHCRKMKDADEREAPWCFEGKQVGPSLVFFPITGEAYSLLTASANELSPKKVGATLVELGAKGEDNAVTTSVLAAALMPPREGDSPDERQEGVERMSRSLKARAKTGLEAYCTGEARDLKWWLPSA